MYSQFCSRLASEGYIVLAMEHRDGSGPVVRVRTRESGEGNDDDEKGGIKETLRRLLYTTIAEVV